MKFPLRNFLTTLVTLATLVVCTSGFTAPACSAGDGGRQKILSYVERGAFNLVAADFGQKINLADKEITTLSSSDQLDADTTARFKARLSTLRGLKTELAGLRLTDVKQLGRVAVALLDVAAEADEDIKLLPEGGVRSTLQKGFDRFWSFIEPLRRFVPERAGAAGCLDRTPANADNTSLNP